MSINIPVGLKIAIINRTFKQKMDRKAQKMNLTSVQLRVLGEVSLLEANGTGEIHQIDLEKAEHVTHPTMIGILKQLEKKGFIVCGTSSGDKRYKRILCTEKSRGIHLEIQKQDDEIFNELCHNLTEEQKEEFLNISDMILKNIY